MVEVLSPAGNMDCLKAAVSSGADAVYFGVGVFNARRRAENFRIEDLRKVVSFCHRSGVRAYLTANTLIKNSELGDYFNLISEAYSAGVDAVIIQHISFIKVIKEHFPGLEVHLSTQATVFNSYYSDLIAGVDRVILPREFTLNQVKQFREKTGIPVEVFVQGALCYSISGQCLFSSFLGGRSGNRGLCAQPCRKKYNNKFILSTRDLCLVKRIPELVEAGVTSIKIEGRLRGPEYVASATSLYRRAVDSFEAGNFSVDDDAFFDMEVAFSREYTEGMLFKEADVVASEAGGKRGLFLGVMEEDKVIRLNAPLRVGDGVGIVTGRGVHGDVVREIEFRGKKVQSACIGQKVKLFINAKRGDEIILSSAVVRRKPYELRKKQEIVVERKKPAEVAFSFGGGELRDELLLVKTYSYKDALEAAYAGADTVFYNVLSKDYPQDDLRISPYIPRYVPDWNAEKIVSLISRLKPEKVFCGDAGIAAKISDKTEVYLDISGNAFNDLDVGFYNNKKITPIISPELSLDEIKDFRDKRFAVYAHGRIPLMSTKYVLREENLRDELGYVFPTRNEGDYKQILNSVPLALFGRVRELREAGIKQFLLDLDSDISSTVKLYKEILCGGRIQKPKGEYTLGNYRRGVL